MLITFFIFKISYYWEYKNHKIAIVYRLIQQHFISWASKGGRKSHSCTTYPDRLEFCTE